MPPNANEMDGSYCVWFAHKRFCGKKPFELPLLSPDEVSRAKAIVDTTVWNMLGDRINMAQGWSGAWVSSVRRFRTSGGISHPLAPEAITVDMIEPVWRLCSLAVELGDAFYPGKHTPESFPFEQEWYTSFLHQALSAYVLHDYLYSAAGSVLRILGTRKGIASDRIRHIIQSLEVATERLFERLWGE
ncbi:hypothetical protein JCM8547_007722 [Rhodosporidiobolus lusitaniae]